MNRALVVLALASCGDNLPPTGAFEIVGHSDLGARGMNAALAVAGSTVYVGSRIDGVAVAIVDVSDPAAPVVTGTIASENVAGLSSRELRAVPDLNLLVILNLACSVDLHGCSGVPATENLAFYDITDRRSPRLLSTYPVTGAFRAPRSPHEMYVWRDHGRVLIVLSAPPSAPQLEIIDATDPAAPARVIAWDAIRDGGLAASGGADNILHSVSLSPDGRTAYLSHQRGGLVLADLGDVIDDVTAPQIRMITPPDHALLWPNAPIGPHSAVAVPDRSLLVVTEEIYAPPYGTGCPWGHLHTVDIADPTTPVLAGDFALPENAPSACAHVAPNTAFTAHNATVTHDLALVTWYAGGLQAIDISDAARPFQLAELRPEPLPSVAKEDPALGGNHVEMWSYPVIEDGLIYVVDVRNGLYIVRYHGRWGEQLDRDFLEGNSNI